MQRPFSYRAVLRVAVGSLWVTGCVEDPPSFTNLGTESATEGLTEGPATTAPAESTDEGSTSDGGDTTTGSVDESSTGPGSSSEDDNSGSICGDGVITGNEECDCGGGPCTPEGLGDKTCVDTTNPMVAGPLTGGVLGCNAASCKFNVDLCTWCGDKQINGLENCEIDMPITETCESLKKGAAGDLFCNEMCSIDTTGCTECGAQFTFDNCADPLWVPQIAHGSAANPPSWACGTVSGVVGPPANGATVWGTNLSGQYLINESAGIISPQIDLMNCGDGESVELRITHWYDFQGGPVNSDGGIVQISDDGISWTTIEPIGGSMYNEQNFLTTSYVPPDNAYGFSGNSPDIATWVESAFDVSAYAGTSDLQVRFVFGSDNSGLDAGWYIDEVNFVGSGGG